MAATAHHLGHAGLRDGHLLTEVVVGHHHARQALGVGMELPGPLLVEGRSGGVAHRGLFILIKAGGGPHTPVESIPQGDWAWEHTFGDQYWGPNILHFAPKMAEHLSRGGQDYRFIL